MNNYYVYQHIDDDGEIVYVGKGRYARAWRHERRNPFHSAWMALQLPFLNVKIVASSLFEEDAFQEEKKLIQQLQPKFNEEYTIVGADRRKQFGKWLSETHSRFAESELQRELGKRAAKSANHPNKRTGTCIHCGFTGNLGHLGRYHNDKCKQRVDSNEIN